jgi:hypothetical protein
VDLSCVSVLGMVAFSSMADCERVFERSDERLPCKSERAQ